MEGCPGGGRKGRRALRPGTGRGRTPRSPAPRRRAAPLRVAQQAGSDVRQYQPASRSRLRTFILFPHVQPALTIRSLDTRTLLTHSPPRQLDTAVPRQAEYKLPSRQKLTPERLLGMRYAGFFGSTDCVLFRRRSAALATHASPSAIGKPLSQDRQRLARCTRRPSAGPPASATAPDRRPARHAAP